jgi:3-hydroxyacyl-CoA dehydrogenase
VAAHNGYKVVLCDLNDKALENGRSIIQKSITRVAKKQHPESEQLQQDLVASVFNNITTTTDPAEAVADADLVVEAIIENIKIKQDLFAMLDKAAKETCIFASNTSSLSISEIASSTSGQRKTRYKSFPFVGGATSTDDVF